MKSIKTYILGMLSAAFLLMLPLSPAHACTSPVGVAGDVLFGDDDNVPAYCDGTNWIAMIGGDSAAGEVAVAGGLVGHWKLDETSGTAVADSSGNSNNGTMVGGMTGANSSVTGAIDTALDMANGATSYYIESISGSEIDNIFDGGGTVSLWYYARSDGSDDEGALFHKSTAYGLVPDGYAMVHNVDADGTLLFRHNTGGFGRRHVWRTNVFPTNQWVHIVVTYDSSTTGDAATDRPQIYFNGVDAYDQWWFDDGANGAGVDDSVADLHIGEWNTDGIIDDFRMYNRILSPSEVQEIYVAGSSSTLTKIVPDGLVGHWRLDETSGTTAADSSSNSNDGTMQGGMTGVNSTAAALINTGLDTADNATDYYIEAGPDAAIDNIFAGGGTITLWYKARSRGSSGYGVVFHKSSAYAIPPDGYAFQHTLEDTGDRIAFTANTGGSGNRQTWLTDSFPLNEWVHIAIVYDSDLTGDAATDRPNIYFNGEDAYFDWWFDIGANNAASSDAATAFSLGEDTDAIFDDVRMYNRMLTQDEVREIFQARDGIRYNDAQRTMEFFDGNQWASMTPEWLQPGTLSGSCAPSVIDFVPTEINASQTTYTVSNYSFTNTDNDQVLVVTTASESAEDVTGVTFNGVALTEAVDTNAAISSSGASIYYLPDPPNVTADIVVTYASAPSNRAGIGAMVLDCVDSATAPITTSATSTTTTISNSITTVTANTLIIDSLMSEANTSVSATTESGQTALVAEDLSTGSEWGVSWKLEATPSSSTMGWAGLADTTESALAIAGFAPSGSGSTSKTTPNLVGYWKLDETTGNTVFDSSGNGNDGTTDQYNSYNVLDTSTRGVIGNALDFRGQRGRIEVPADPSIANIFHSGGTYAAWAYIVDANNNWSKIFAKGNQTVNFGAESASGANVDFKFSHAFTGDDGNWRATNPIPTDAWYHLAVTYDCSDINNDPILYVNGVAVAMTETGTPTLTCSDDSAFNLGIGDNDTSGSDRGWRGILDELRIYDRILNASEIAQLYNMAPHMGTSTALPAGCPNIGDVCDDGTIYAGLSPDGNVAMFTTQSDQPNTTWNNGNSSGLVDVSGSVSGDVDGDGHTATLAITDSDSVTSGFQPHLAALSCNNLVSNGADDWYLPARDELLLVRNNLGSTDALRAQYGFGTGQYWGSRQTSTVAGVRIQFSDGGTGGTNKENPRPFRCVRKGPAPRCANPYGMEGDVVYNTTHTVLQFCDGTRWRAIGK